MHEIELINLACGEFTNCFVINNGCADRRDEQLVKAKSVSFRLEIRRFKLNTFHFFASFVWSRYIGNSLSKVFRVRLKQREKRDRKGIEGEQSKRKCLRFKFGH